MKLDVKIQLLKFCFAVLNSVFLALGLSVAGCAIWILFDKGNFLSVLPSDELHTVGVGLLVIGGVVLAASIVGCFGAQSENRLLLLTYLVFLIVLVLGQLFITLLLLFYRPQIEDSLDSVVDQIILTFGQGHSRDRLMDNLQHYGKCCGRTGPADWQKNSFILGLNLTNPVVLPCSCFTSYRLSFNSSWCFNISGFLTAPTFGLGNGSYEQGCKDNLRDWLQENALTVVAMDFSLIFMQVLQFVLAVYLYRAIVRKSALKQTSSLVNPDPAHYDHTPDSELDYGEQNDAYIHPEDSDYIDPAHPAHYHDYPNYVELENHHENQDQIYQPARGYQQASRKMDF